MQIYNPIIESSYMPSLPTFMPDSSKYRLAWNARSQTPLNTYENDLMSLQLAQQMEVNSKYISQQRQAQEQQRTKRDDAESRFLATGEAIKRMMQQVKMNAATIIVDSELKGSNSPSSSTSLKQTFSTSCMRNTSFSTHCQQTRHVAVVAKSKSQTLRSTVKSTMPKSLRWSSNNQISAKQRVQIVHMHANASSDRRTWVQNRLFRK